METVDPPNRFAYRWIPWTRPTSRFPSIRYPAPLVEYILEETPDGTRVTVMESGFGGLPVDMREKIVQGNTEGWIFKTTALLDYLVAEQAG